MLPVSLGLAAAVLSGCMGEAAEPVVEVVQPEAPAFHFASGTLELGDFDPATLGDDLFDPCTELSLIHISEPTRSPQRSTRQRG